MRRDLLMQVVQHKPDSTADSVLIQKASTWARVKSRDPGTPDLGAWILISEYRNILWGELQEIGVEDATYVRAVIKMVIEEPLSSKGELQFFDIWPTFGVN